MILLLLFFVSFSFIPVLGADCSAKVPEVGCALADYLRQDGPKSEDLELDKPVHGKSSGGSTGTMGEYCVYSAGGGSVSHYFCGGSAAGGGETGNWLAARRKLDFWRSLPGTYHNEGTVTHSTFNQSRDSFNSIASELNTVSKNVAEAHQNYFGQQAKPSAQAVAQSALPYIVEGLEKLKDLPKLVAAKVRTGGAPLIDASAPRFASAPLQKRWQEVLHAEGNPSVLFKRLEPLWRIFLTGKSDLPSPDQIGLKTIYERYFTSEGILASQIFGKDLAVLAKAVSRRVRSPLNATSGRAVRSQLNGWLVQMAGRDASAPNSEERGQLALVLGADAALASGDELSGFRLLAHSNQMSGELTPVKILTADEGEGGALTRHYLSGVVATLNLTGAESLITTGKTIYSRSFTVGVLALRALRAEPILVRAAHGDENRIVALAEKVGEHPKFKNGETFDYSDLNKLVSR